MTTDLTGVIPAIPSPCDDNDLLLEDALSQMSHDLFKAGVHGLYVCGGTGDGLRISPEDHKRAVAVTVEAAKPHNGAIIAHVGNRSTRDAIELAQAAAANGAHAISSMPPGYSTFQQIKQYYVDLAAATDLPLIVYHIPPLTNINTTVAQMLELLEIEHVAGAKICTFEMIYFMQVLFERPDAILINGMDEMFVPGLLYGAVGGIGMWYPIFPGAFLGMYDAVNRGDIERAMHLQKLFVDLSRFGWEYNMRGIYKIVMEMKGMDFQPFRRPHAEFDDDVAAMLHRELPPRVEALEQAIEAAEAVT